MSTLKTTYIKNPDNTGTSNVELEQSGTITVSGGVNASGIITASSFSGDITGTSATFSGNVSVGGTLTYDDVTNVDSVGLVTARTGINVLAGGIDAVGVVTATSFDGSGAGLTNLPAGNLTGTLPAIDGSNLTGIDAGGSNVTVVTSNTTLSANSAYMINAADIVVTLPSSPSTGDGIDILNNVAGIHTIARNGSTIEGIAEDMNFSEGGLSFKIWYTGSTWSLF